MKLFRELRCLFGLHEFQKVGEMANMDMVILRCRNCGKQIGVAKSRIKEYKLFGQRFFL